MVAKGIAPDATAGRVKTMGLSMLCAVVTQLGSCHPGLQDRKSNRARLGCRRHSSPWQANPNDGVLRELARVALPTARV